jgi:hypothetical protein
VCIGRQENDYGNRLVGFLWRLEERVDAIIEILNSVRKWKKAQSAYLPEIDTRLDASFGHRNININS